MLTGPHHTQQKSHKNAVIISIVRKKRSKSSLHRSNPGHLVNLQEQKIDDMLSILSNCEFLYQCTCYVVHFHLHTMLHQSRTPEISHYLQALIFTKYTQPSVNIIHHWMNELMVVFF